MALLLKYEPLFKNFGFCPNPVVKYGIPKEANTDPITGDPKLLGTFEHEQWWKEQINRCLNGYTTQGIFISGREYYYLNFCVISTVGIGNHYPLFTDLHHEIFNTIETAKKNRKGLIMLKARRIGISFVMSEGVFDYGMRFLNSYEGAVCAGLTTYAEEFMNKIRFNLSLKPRELSIHLLKNRKEELVTGWTANLNGEWLEQGLKNRIHSKTMKINPDIFRGLKLNDVVFEEAGEFEKLIPGFNATKPCLMMGDLMIGTPYIYGTATTQNKNDDFKEMYHNPDAFNLIKLFIPSQRFFFPCVEGTETINLSESDDTPYVSALFPHKENRIGMSDVRRAHERIDNERARLLLDEKNKDAYYSYLREYCTTEEEAFMKFQSNPFDNALLNAQRFRVRSEPLKYNKFRLEWEKDNEGNLIIPFKINAVPLKPDENPEIFIKIICHPQPNYLNLDIAGIDSYDQDQAVSSYSLGAMIVYRRGHLIQGLEKNLPIAQICARPKNKHTFYEYCLKTAIYYNLSGGVLIDMANPLVSDYFEKMGCSKYLSDRPRSFDSPNSTVTNKTGIRLTQYSKPIMVGIIQTDIYDNVNKWYFEELLDDTINYDVSNKKSDWDTTDALGLALMKDRDLKRPVLDIKDMTKDNPYAMPQWEMDNNGNLVDSTNYQEEVSKIMALAKNSVV